MAGFIRQRAPGRSRRIFQRISSSSTAQLVLSPYRQLPLDGPCTSCVIADDELLLGPNALSERFCPSVQSFSL